MSDYTGRIDDLEARLEKARANFEPPDDDQRRDRAMTYLREGAGPAVHIYCEVRTGGPDLPAEEIERLEAVMNGFLDLYERCFGVDSDQEVPIRTAAEVLIETHNVRHVAEVVTGVPTDR